VEEVGKGGRGWEVSGWEVSEWEVSGVGKPANSTQSICSMLLIDVILSSVAQLEECALTKCSKIWSKMLVSTVGLTQITHFV